MRKYPRLDPEDPIEQGLLKATFVTKSWPDIPKRLQKIEGWNEKPIEELLRDAQNIFIRGRRRHRSRRQAAWSPLWTMWSDSDGSGCSRQTWRNANPRCQQRDKREMQGKISKNINGYYKC